MAYYEGCNLSGRIRDASQPLGAAEALSIAIQVARGLAEAHAHDVVHRDIKPSNILVTPQGLVKIVDFGLAAMADSEQLTLAGACMGTPAYMSPEQALGRAVDRRSDIWSLGVVLLEMLTRQRSFRGEALQAVLYQVVHGDIPALDSLQEPLRTVVGRALERDVEKRYLSADLFLAALEAVAQPVTAAPPEPSPDVPTARLPRNLRRIALALLAAAILATAGLGAAHYWKGRPAGNNAGMPRAATVYDKYRQAVELMKRWDKEGNLNRAAALLTETTQADPTFALGFARLAEAQRLSYALSRDQKALDAAGKSADEALRLNPELAPVQVVWGRIQALRGNNDLAIASFERAVHTDPNDSDAQLAIARQYERLGRLGDAEAAFKKAGLLDPDGIAPHDFYANFLYRQGRFPEAIREWQTVIRIAPDHAAAWVNLGAAMSESGSLDEAIKAYKQAIAFKPTDMAFNNLGAVFERTGRYQEAVDAYRRAIGMNGENYLSHGNLAVAYSRMEGFGAQAQQSFGRAIELGEKARQANPRDANVHLCLARYYAWTANPALSLQRLGTALTLAPDSPAIQAGGAEVYQLLGQRKKALGLAKRALELGYSRRRMEQDPGLSGLLPQLK
jgi:tetratricopeptide (TPR) repeat protein